MVRKVLAACAIALAPGGAAGEPALPSATQPGIIFVAADDMTRPWVSLISQGFRDVTLTAREQPALHFEYLDFARFADPAYHGELRRWLRAKYQSTRIDVVVALGEEALAFLAAAPGEPWPEASVIYAEAGGVSIDVPRLLPHATGVIIDDHFADALRVVTRILPATTHVALVAGASRVEEARFGGFADKVRKAGLQPIVLSGLGLDEIVATVARLPPATVVYILAPVVDGTGRVLPPSRPCASIATAASVPAFTLAQHDVGCGVVGGLVRDWALVGQLVGEQALARLHGPLADVVRIPATAFASLTFDERQLKRWGIDESRLPTGSTVRFRATNFWRDHRMLSLAALSVFALQAALIVGLGLERQRRRRAEVDSRRHLVTMAHLDRRAALGELTTALAHELHQPLAAILRNSEAAAMQLSAGRATQAELLEIIDDIRRDDKRAAAIIKRLRSLLEKHELESTAVDVHDVVIETVAVAALDAAARGVRVDVELAAEHRIVTGDKVHLQQVLLNLLLNGIDAVAQMRPDRRRLTVRSVSDDSSVQVRVIDAGPGLAPDVAPQMFDPFFSTKGSDRGHGLGLGLSIARSIVEAHGGRILAKNNDRDGATVWFTLPLRPTEQT